MSGFAEGEESQCDSYGNLDGNRKGKGGDVMLLRWKAVGTSLGDLGNLSVVTLCGVVVWELTLEMPAERGKRGSCGSIASWELTQASAFPEGKEGCCPSPQAYPLECRFCTSPLEKCEHPPHPRPLHTCCVWPSALFGIAELQCGDEVR